MSNASVVGVASPDEDLHRVQGEDAPLWLICGFMALGLSMALAAAYLLARSDARTLPSASSSVGIVQSRPAKPLVQSASALRPMSAATENSSGEKTSPANEIKSRNGDCLPVVQVAFAHKSARPILDGVEPQLEPLLRWMKDNPDATLFVEGHADPKGGEAYNVMLSYSRAQAVVAWLSSLGIEKQRMSSLAAGTSLPKNPALIIADNRMVLLQIAGVSICQTEGLQKK